MSTSHRTHAATREHANSGAAARRPAYRAPETAPAIPNGTMAQLLRGADANVELPVLLKAEPCKCGGRCAHCRARNGARDGEQHEHDDAVHRVQRKAVTGGAHAALPAPIPTAGGAPIPPAVRDALERRFGERFDDVRVHADDAAADATRALRARAFTHGRDVFFARDQYAPESVEGRALLAHELTHVVQQRRGRFPFAAASGVAGVRTRLEAEAERVEADVRAGAATPASVRESSAPGLVYRAPDWLDEAIQAVVPAAGALTEEALEALADRVIARLGEDADPVMRALIRLRADVRALRGSVQHLFFPPEVVARMEALYTALLAHAPAWMPRPAISFAGTPTLQAAQVLAIPVVLILLLLVMLILIWWIITNNIPEVRQAREESLRRFLEWIRDAVQRRSTPEPKTKPKTEPKTKPKAEPKTEPKPEPKPDPKKPKPLGPDVFPEPRGGCRIEAIAQRGGNSCHDDFATLISGVTREFRVTTPEGASADFDAIGHDLVAYEVKTGYRYLLGTSPSTEALRRNTINGFIDQSQNQLLVATRCGYPLLWVFNEAQVADFVDGFIQPMVTSQTFPCDEDR